MALDLSTPEAPPRRATTIKTKTQPVSNTPVKPLQQIREEGCNEFFQGLSYITATVGWYADSGTLSIHGPKMANKLAEISEDNENVAKAVDYICKGSPILELVLIFGTFALQIAANHKLVPADKFGDLVQDPEMISAEVKTELMRQKTELLRRQKEQQDAMMEMQAQILQAQTAQNGHVYTENVTVE